MMKIKFYDVEHGCCTHIITPNGKHILVDVGSKSDSSIVDHIRKHYTSTIHQLYITHPHEDHIYDIPRLVETMTLKVLSRPKDAFPIKPQKQEDTHQAIADAVNNLNETYTTPIADDDSPTNENNNGGVEFETIQAPLSKRTKDDLNTFSNIIIVKYQGWKFVLMGDNPSSILQYMIDNDISDIKSKVDDATILLAPHHGRSGEFCKDYFNCVNPILSIISDKPIVHTTQNDSSSLYKGRGCELYGSMRYVLSTRKDGNITFEVTKDNCTVSYSKDEY
ncbi:MAG: MBL fold metallo-hydrolase [Rikenellaceae bacterium]